jgi:hypothetical protein
MLYQSVWKHRGMLAGDVHTVGFFNGPDTKNTMAARSVCGCTHAARRCYGEAMHNRNASLYVFLREDV